MGEQFRQSKPPRAVARAEETPARDEAEAALAGPISTIRGLENPSIDEVPKLAELQTRLIETRSALEEASAETQRLRIEADQSSRSSKALARELQQMAMRLAATQMEAERLARETTKLRRSVFFKVFRELARIEGQIRALGGRGGQTPVERGEAGAATNPALSRRKLELRRRLRAEFDAFVASSGSLTLPASAQPDVSILIVVFNQAELSYGCLSSLADCLQGSELRCEVIILDNGSSDETGVLLDRLAGATVVRNAQNIHFLRGVNQIARLAVASRLLLLNNDAQLLPGSLEAAVATLDSSADIGAVGGRIILADGALQEAGSIIWRDGACTGYARGYDPEAPEVMFRRDVDYCSGAFLLTPRALFRELGGFDERYAPAYYEETDYCVRLWKQGYRVVYEPGAVVRHYEFGSAGESALALQQRNRGVFLERHGVWLEGQWPRTAQSLSAAARRRTERKRVLMIDDHVPHEFFGSGAPRARMILQELAQIADVTFLPATTESQSWSQVRAAIPAEVEVLKDDTRETLARVLAARRGLYDAIFVSRSRNMAALAAASDEDASLIGGATLVYDAEAVSAIREAQKRTLLGSPMSADEARQLLNAELALADRADQVIAVSKSEQRLFQSRRARPVHVLGHAFDVDPTPASFDERTEILFVGAVHEDDSPNGDSLRWFSADILPLIRKELGPGTTLRVVGLNRSAEVAGLEGLRFVGPVGDLRAEFERARLFVAPTRFAAGIPHKVGQAAAFGVPVVATQLLAEQIGWETGRQLLSAATARGFADACIRLYRDRDLWAELRGAALKKCAEDWPPNRFGDVLAAILANALTDDAVAPRSCEHLAPSEGAAATLEALG